VVVSLSAQVRVFLACDVTDMRKSFDGLCALIEHGFSRDPYTGDVFAFFNRRRTHVKLLVWDANGFWLFAKRLERGTFEHWSPSPNSTTHIEIDRARLLMLLDGIAMKNAKLRRHFARSVRIDGSGGGRKEDHGRSRTTR